MGDDTVLHSRLITLQRKEALEKMREWRAASANREGTLSDMALIELLNRLYPLS